MLKKKTLWAILTTLILFTASSISNADTISSSTSCVNGVCTTCVNGVCTTNNPNNPPAPQPQKTESNTKTTQCKANQCYYKSQNTCHSTGDIIEYKNKYWMCRDGVWDMQCSSYQGQPYFTGEMVKNSRGVIWECRNSNWYRIGCEQGSCYYKSEDRCYNTSQTIKYRDYYWTCYYGVWEKRCVYNNTYYYNGDQILDAKNVVFECRDGQWKTLGCPEGLCYYKSQNKCYLPGEITTYNNKYFLCYNGNWEKICHFNNTYYYSGDEIVDAKNMVWKCTSEGTWSYKGCEQYSCYYASEKRCVANKKTIKYNGVDWKCVKGTWIKKDKECDFDECLYKDKCYDVGDKITDDYGTKWKCIDDDGEIRWEPI